MQPKKPRFNPLVIAIVLAAVLMVWSVLGGTGGSASGSVNVLSTVTKDTKDEETIASPTPIVILSKYNYGGSSVAAGSSTNLSFSFTNTSKTIKIENVMVTVTGGSVVNQGRLNGAQKISISGGSVETQQTSAKELVLSGGSLTVREPVRRKVPRKTMRPVAMAIMMNIITTPSFSPAMTGMTQQM